MISFLGSMTVAATLAGAAPMVASGQTPAYRAPAAQSGATWVPARSSGLASVRRTVTVSLDRVTIQQAIDEIARQAGVTIGYGDEVIASGARVTLAATGRTVGQALSAALQDTGLEAYVSLGTGRIIVREAPPTGALYGRVTDSAQGAPLRDVTVSVLKSDLQATTNDSGYYRILNVPAGIHGVVARLIGYAPRQLGVAVEDGEAVRLDFVLQSSAARLNELVVTATGERRRYELGNAIATIDVDSLVRTQPVTNIASLLETRVPGLVVTHTSGAPGDPERLRLRGVNSVTRSNDPIVIVDGIRIYAEQSNARAANLAGVLPWSGAGLTGTSQIAAPSPLDQLDPHSLDRIEVFKGPSAATLYGADAANGVIVVTTKRGKAGPPRWDFSADYGPSYMPGEYPDAYYSWGHRIATGLIGRCPVYDFTCTVDSVVTYQSLNDPDLTILGKGHREAVSLGVNGGSDALTYALTGSFSNETGLLKLPELENRLLTELRGEAPPDWVQRPHNLGDWHATGRVTFELSSKADVAFTSTVSRSRQRRSSMDQLIQEMMGLYVDTLNNLFYPATDNSEFARIRMLSQGYQQTVAEATSFTDGVHVNWRPLGWLTTTADVGINIISRKDEIVKARAPAGEPQYATDIWDPLDDFGTGFFNTGNGNSSVATANMGAIAVAPISGGLRLRTAFGGNFTRSRTSDLIATGSDLSPGASGLGGAREIRTLEQKSAITSFGWYIEPTLEHKRFFLSTGLRLDGADTYGSQQSLAAFPKVSISYLLSDEPFFPFKRVFSTLRLRAAYGQAGVQPGPTDRLRLYNTTPVWLGSGTLDAHLLRSLGNDGLKPERSREFEGGLDADLFGQALTLEATVYRKDRVDALIPLKVPPSVNGGGEVLVNIGKVRNSGFEIGLGTNLLRGEFLTFGTQMHVSRNRNVVVSTGEIGMIEQIDVGGRTRVMDGYPLFGRWELPIIGYADANGDGRISASEVQVGDDPVYLGASEPDYEAALYTNLSLFRGIVTASAGFSYLDGQLQINNVALTNRAITRAANDPAAPLGEQAAIAALEKTQYGISQTVSTFRFNSLSLAFNATPEFARRYLGARSASLTVQGTNLGLRSNYRGKDPAVNAYATGNVIADTGQLPLPRTWSFGIRLGY